MKKIYGKKKVNCRKKILDKIYKNIWGKKQKN